MKGVSLGLDEALRLTLERIHPLPREDVALADSVGRIGALELLALVDSPTTDASLKDGYALSCRDVAAATAQEPVRLVVSGSVAAGDRNRARLEPGAVIKVFTGARMPTGADAVIAEEFVEREGRCVVIDGPVERGANILRRGSDVAALKPILRPGRQITPGLAGLLAAAGHATVPVIGVPRVGIIGTGDEIVEPGRPLDDGKLYASNIMTLAGWCDAYRMKTRLAIVRDDHTDIRDALDALSTETEAVITSGGAWTGDRDIVVHVLETLGWEKVFHRVRMGPGKAVGFGLLKGKPLFVLPGGPPSNLTGFLQIALPGLLALAGSPHPGLPRINARLVSTLKGRDMNWTDFFFGNLATEGDLPVFHPLEYRSRLGSIAEASAMASIPEGVDRLEEGSVVRVQLLR